MQQALSASTCLLLELPSPWLCQLVTALEPASRTHLLATSKQGRDLVLAGSSSITCSFRLAADPPDTGAVCSSLQLLRRCREGAQVRLRLQDYGDSDEDRVACTMWLTSLFVRGSLAPGLPLHRVTHVEMRCYPFGDLVPVWLAQACPNLRSLERSGDIRHPPRTHFAPVPCPQLRDLHVSYVQKPEHNADITEQQLAQQVRSLTGLQQLSVGANDDNEYDETRTILLSAQFCLQALVHPLAHQLTALTLDHATIPLAQLLSTRWPQLQQLRAAMCTVEDAALDLLLANAPQLSSLQVYDFSISGSRACKQCRWRTLEVAADMSVKDLAWLPLAELSVIRFRELLVEAADLQHAAAAAINIPTGCQLVSEGPPGPDAGDAVYVQLQGVWSAAAPPAGQPAALLPLLLRLSCGVLCVRGTDPEQLDGRGTEKLDSSWLPVLAGLGCHTLVVDPCLLPASMWVALLPHMPQLRVLRLMQPWGSRLQQLMGPLTALCVLAHRPLQLQVTHWAAVGLPRDWQAQLTAFMLGAGHQHVTLQVLESSYWGLQ